MALLKLIPIGQAYASETDALEATEALKAGGFEEEDISVITPSMIESANPWMLDKGTRDGVDSTEMLAQVIMSVHEASGIPASHAMVYADNIQQGKSLAIITAPFGSALQATDILNTGKEIDIGEMPELDYHSWQQPAPLSALLNIPVLSSRRSWMSRTFGELTEPGYRPTEKLMGGLLSDNATPLSSAAGLNVLKDNPTPLSSAMGMKALKENPTPLSDKIGFKPLSEDTPGRKTSSFGFPLLSNDPTPLSSLLGLKVLSRDD